MSVRVVARIRPLLKTEIERDVIVHASGEEGNKPTVVKIPNPKNEAEEYSFQFSGVYGGAVGAAQEKGQQELFDGEGMYMYARPVAIHVRLILESYSRTYDKTPLLRIRRYNICLRRYRDRQNSHHARWQKPCRSWHDS